MSWGYRYREYVPVAKKQSRGNAYACKVAKKQGREVQPVSIQGTTIAKTFWAKAWCDHLESYSDFANRLPRGRTYVRNGSVVDLHITAGRLEAIVAGSDPYEVTVEITRLEARRWKKIQSECASSIDSLLDLLGGRFSDRVMQRLTHRSGGLFPAPHEIKMDCSCPDWAGVCKHVAAVLYGVAAHLDTRPELLFLLRGVDHHELVSEAVSEGNLSTAFGEPSTDLAGEDLGAMFGIELEKTIASPAQRTSKKKRANTKKSTSTRATKKKASTKKASTKKASPNKAAQSKTRIKTKAAKVAGVKKTKTVNAAKQKATVKTSAKKRSRPKSSVKD